MSAPFVDALGDELRAAATRRVAAVANGRRRRAGRAGALLASGALGAIVLLGLVHPPPAKADVRVEHLGGRVHVTLVDVEQRAERIEAELREAGLDVSVVAVPVGPSAVGRFVGHVADRLPPELTMVDGGRSTFAGFSVPEGWAGQLDLQVGRVARAGETYAAFSDALAPGEPLQCTQVLGRPAVEVGAEIQRRALEPAFLAVGDGPALRVDAANLRGSGRARWFVTGVDAISPQDLLVRIGPEPPAPASEDRSC
ncbi:MAG: hypothetical protein Q8K58_11305 [Acidimicrobiales bacterium]|nr:hypothetical protein [Acidimicrobiales bacterium]